MKISVLKNSCRFNGEPLAVATNQMGGWPQGDQAGGLFQGCRTWDNVVLASD